MLGLSQEAYTARVAAGILGVQPLRCPTEPFGECPRLDRAVVEGDAPRQTMRGHRVQQRGLEHRETLPAHLLGWRHRSQAR
ncbi:hypothetical protein ACFQ9Z_34590 [Streptomyces sp. NPDC056580]|uniref:hypothetical protein n=1 Tax=Streptomyces sp. NPDC056580 TaxID=3345872 RepID=UPI003680AA92